MDMIFRFSTLKLLKNSLNVSDTMPKNFFVDQCNIANNDDFKSFKYKTKLLGNTEANGANGILKNATIAVPLKYLSNFWKSHEIPLINFKVELKLTWKKYCVLSAAGVDNNDVNSNNIFTIRGTKLYVPAVTLSAREYQILSKGFERSNYWNEYDNYNVIIIKKLLCPTHWFWYKTIWRN